MKIRLLTAALATVAVTAAPAHAADVTVHFGLSAGTYAPTGAACTLTVPAGASGLQVLDAAVANLCINSYDTVTFDFGTFVSCIDEVCGQTTPAAGTYWNMYENGVSTWYGVDGFSADAGDELSFAYTAWTV
jgi:hypothetical protein